MKHSFVSDLRRRDAEWSARWPKLTTALRILSASAYDIFFPLLSAVLGLLFGVTTAYLVANGQADPSTGASALNLIAIVYCLTLFILNVIDRWLAQANQRRLSSSSLTSGAGGARSRTEGEE